MDVDGPASKVLLRLALNKSARHVVKRTLHTCHLRSRMVEGVIPSSGGSSSSSMALPRPAENLSVAEAVRETTLSKGSSKKRAATVKQAKTKLSVAETKLTELNALKQELEEVADATMSLALQLYVSSAS